MKVRESRGSKIPSQKKEKKSIYGCVDFPSNAHILRLCLLWDMLFMDLSFESDEIEGSKALSCAAISETWLTVSVMMMMMKIMEVPPFMHAYI